jgi:hypothetical protein
VFKFYHTRLYARWSGLCTTILRKWDNL